MRHTSTRPARATTLLATALLLLVGASGFAPAPAYAVTCSSTDVTVVVQFPDRTEVGCAKGDPSSGEAALQKAGFSFTYAQGSGAGAICRLDGYPSDQTCTAMPPGDAYWAYFHAEPGGDWVYSTRGARAYDPEPGSVEGWRFGGGEKPSGKAPAVSTPAPPKPTKAPVSKPTRKPASKPASTATSAAASPGASASASASATGGVAPGTAATSGPSVGASPTTPEPSTSPDASASERLADSAAADDSDGGLSWLWGLGLLAVLGAAGVGVVIARRQG